LKTVTKFYVLFAFYEPQQIVYFNCMYVLKVSHKTIFLLSAKEHFSVPHSRAVAT